MLHKCNFGSSIGYQNLSFHLPFQEIHQTTHLLAASLCGFSQPGHQLDISELPQGVYVLRIQATSGKQYSARIVKE